MAYPLTLIQGGGIKTPPRPEWRPLPVYVRNTLLTLAESSEEICGYILAHHEIIIIENVSSSPKDSFVFNPVQQSYVVEIHLNEIIGIFHTHPGGIAKPSRKDILGWPPIAELRYWIVGVEDGVREWRKDGDLVIPVGP